MDSETKKQTITLHSFSNQLHKLFLEKKNMKNSVAYKTRKLLFYKSLGIVSEC